jgi:hypothetical protein
MTDTVAMTTELLDPQRISAPDKSGRQTILQISATSFDSREFALETVAEMACRKSSFDLPRESSLVDFAAVIGRRDST